MAIPKYKMPLDLATKLPLVPIATQQELSLPTLAVSLPELMPFHWLRLVRPSGELVLFQLVH